MSATGLAKKHATALGLTPEQLGVDDAAVAQALDVARRLAGVGVPIFIATPATDELGNWLPEGGHSKCGYWLPRGWNNSEADAAVVDEWSPGDALGAVMGHTLDALDIDPRNEGHLSAVELQDVWPRVYGRASTPSGGTHDLVASLGVRKGKPGPGIDVQAGDGEGKGRGFVFIAPTVKISKSDGLPKAYEWVELPDLEAIKSDADSDESGGGFAELVNASRGKGSVSGTRPEFTVTNETGLLLYEFDGADVFLGFAPEQEISAGVRDEWSFRFAWHLRGCDIPMVEARKLMSKVRFEQVGNDPFTTKDALRKVDKAYETYPAGKSAKEIRPAFRFYDARELSAATPPIEFLVRGVLTQGTYGPLAGAKKSMKSHTIDDLGLAVASGRRFLGRFEIPRPGPVLNFVSEGGRVPYQRRRQRLATAMGISKDELKELPILTTFDVHDIDSKEFRDEIKRQLDKFQPVLVAIDSLYGFHPAGIEATNIYDRGPMLTRLSDLLGREAALIIADHFNKTGSTGLDLDSIAQAGMAAWADSWILQKHRIPARPDIGEFRLHTEFGSREWGASQYEIDWHTGEADPETMLHRGELAREVRPARYGGSGGACKMADDPEARALQFVDDAEPFTYTLSSLAKAIGGNRLRTVEVILALVKRGELVSNSVKRQEKNGSRVRNLLGRPGPDARTDANGGDGY